MVKLIVLCASLMGSSLGCGSPPPPASPSKAPEAETAGPEKATSEPGSAESSTPPKEAPPDKPPCSSLQKAKCKVTVGCAWYEQAGKNKCVDE